MAGTEHPSSTTRHSANRTDHGVLDPKPVCSWPREGKGLVSDHTANTTHGATPSSRITQLLTPGVGSMATHLELHTLGSESWILSFTDRVTSRGPLYHPEPQFPCLLKGRATARVKEMGTWKRCCEKIRWRRHGRLLFFSCSLSVSLQLVCPVLSLSHMLLSLSHSLGSKEAVTMMLVDTVKEKGKNPLEGKEVRSRCVEHLLLLTRTKAMMITADPHSLLWRGERNSIYCVAAEAGHRARHLPIHYV